MRILAVILFLLQLYVFGQQGELRDIVFDDSIKTVSLYRKGWETSTAVIELKSGSKLSLHFDRLGSDYKSYQYTLIHCNRNWEESNLLKTEYSNVLGIPSIENVENSFNTTVDYTHYSVDFPNDDITINLSGNYILKVYEEYNENVIVLQKRFIVVENLLSIENMEAKQATVVEYMDEKQEIDFTLISKAMDVNNPFEDLFCVLLQNGKWDNAIKGFKPLYVKTDQLVYDLDDENVFFGISEYRNFNFKSFTYQTEFVDKYRYEGNDWHVYLIPDDVRRFKVYQDNKDINGKFLVAIDDDRDPNLEADYAYVHFYLPYDVQETTGDIYVYGALTGWKCSAANKMIYNYDKLQYELTLLLKQGYYDYYYVFKDSKTNEIDYTLVEGSHYQTENDYSLIVYIYDHILGYDRIIAYNRVNSIHK